MYLTDGSGSSRSGAGTDAVNRRNSAVLLDYDGTLTPPDELPAVAWVEKLYDDGHLDDAYWERFEDALENRGTSGDRELEGELLSIVTQGLEGEDKGAVYASTTDFVSEYRDDMLTQSADELLRELNHRGPEPFVISLSPRILLGALSDQSNLVENNIYANKFGVCRDGRFSGDLSINLFEMGKGPVVQNIANDRYIRAAAVDTTSDLPLLRMAEDGYAVAPTDDLRREIDADEDMADVMVVDSIDEVAEELTG
ncbi:MAG: HAD family hydrolase [Candidatus Nanohaloarchaea archaeon]